MATQAKTSRSRQPSSVMLRRLGPAMTAATFSLFVLMGLTAYLSPFGYMTVTALKNREMITESDAPFWPAVKATYTYEGGEYPIYEVPTEDGVKHWALYKKGREESFFIDPHNPEAGPIQWTGRWRTLEHAWQFSPLWENLSQAWKELRMPLLLRNMMVIAVAGAIGTTLSCVIVAYGFARFRIPGKAERVSTPS